MRTVSIVGAGPGAKDLLTIRAAELIKTADVLIWTDSLVSPEIPFLAPKNCEKIKTSSLTLEEILPLIRDRSQKNKKVIRLHDGDPSLYGAIAEEINGLKDFGIEVDVVPGISAYQATAAFLKTELTIPGLVQTIILSRTSGETEVPYTERLENLASIKASLCLYLSARHVESVEKILLKHYDPNTPVAIAYRISWKDEWVKMVPLKTMASESIKKGLIRTTLYIISPALTSNKLRSKLYSPTHEHLFRRKS